MAPDDAIWKQLGDIAVTVQAHAIPEHRWVAWCDDGTMYVLVQATNRGTVYQSQHAFSLMELRRNVLLESDALVYSVIAGRVREMREAALADLETPTGTRNARVK